MLPVAEGSWWRPAAAEFLGVFALVYIGAGSIVTLSQINTSSGGGQNTVILLGVALAHGLAIAVMVTALGHLSGGHYNPAVTFAAMLTRRIRTPLALVYVVAQLVGGVAAAYLLVASLPADWWQNVWLGTPTVYGTVTDAVGELSPAKAILVEAALTFFLVLVIFGVGMDDRNTSRAVAGLAIGLTITLDILMGGYLTGAAMNPARAFATALASGQWTLHYVYWAGPLLGAAVAGLVYDLSFVETRLKPSGIPPAAAPSSPAGADTSGTPMPPETPSPSESPPSS